MIAYASEGYSGNGTPMQATPQIVDEIGNVLFSGTPVIATTAGPSGYATTPSGAPMYLYSYVFDGIPSEIVAANVRRHLRFVLDRVINSVPQGTPVTMGSLPLTFVSDTSCFELLQIGAGDATPVPAVDAHFGCPGLLPPGTCIDKTSAALAAGRDYQQTTRKVSLDCGKQQNADCPASLGNQAAAYNALVGAQSMVPLYCK